MYLVVGKENCSRCDMVKNILNNKNVKYEYKLLDQLDENVKKEYIKLARQLGKLEMPLIIKENKLIDIKEVI